MCTLAIDIGGSAIKYALISKDTVPALSHIGKIGPIENNLEAVLQAIKRIYYQFQSSVESIAVSACMIVNTENGFVYEGGSYSNIRNVNLRDEISNVCNHLPVVVESDGDCCLKAELRYGSLKGCQNAGVFVFGSGIACAVLIDGIIAKGHLCSAGEVSLCLADSKYSSMDASFWAQVSGVTFACQHLSQHIAPKSSPLNGWDLFHYLRAGNTHASQILNDMCEEAARHIYNYCMLLSPEKIAIGGGISNEPEFIELLKRKIDTLYRQMDAVRPMYHPIVTACTYRNHANLIGAYVRMEEEKY